MTTLFIYLFIFFCVCVCLKLDGILGHAFLHISPSKQKAGESLFSLFSSI